MLKPPKLNPGDKIATVSLSWGGPSVFPHRYHVGVQQLQDEFGLQIVEMPNTLKAVDWLSRNPKARADDLMQAFSDPSIKGIFTTIGGNDSIRFLPFLDLDVIRNNPKIFMGYSDNTISHLVCYKAGLISFYGPSIMAEFAENGGMFPYMVQALRKTLFSSDVIGEVKPSTDGWAVERLEWGDPANQNIKRKLNPSTGWKFLQGKGIRRGHLIGGCIEVLDWARGLDIFPENWQDAILFLETSEDAPPPEMVTYTLRVFAAMEILQQLSGILFGRPGGNISPETFADYDRAILKVVNEEQGLTDLPIITHMDFGHTAPMFVLPYGVQAEIDCETKTLFVLENAVSSLTKGIIMNKYEAIIIGAGHNGLVAAAYLAKQGKKVLVLERRAIVGGSLVTESFGEKFKVDSIHAGGTLRPDILKDLKLASHGLVVDSVRKPFISLLGRTASPTYQDHLVLDPDPVKAADSIKQFSEKDASRWSEFVRFMDKSAKILEKAYSTIMPRLPMNFGVKEGFGLTKLGLNLRLAGRKDMLNFIRALPMTAQELVEEYFESEVVKAAVASLGIHGFTLGPMGAGTGYTLIHNWLNRGGMSHVNVGKAGEITSALANAVRTHGGEIRCDAEVASIKVENQIAKGIVLSSGEEISANVILSSADPKHTLLKLVGPRELPPEFVWHTQSIKMRGSVAKVHLLLDDVGKGLAPIQGRPQGTPLPDGTFVIAPSIKYLERAYDATKYGEISEKPYLEVTTSGKTVSIHFQFAPYSLKNSSWQIEGSKVEKLAIDTLSEYFPNLNSRISNSHVITPLDLEITYGLTEGDLNHGQLMLDQFLFMRPIPGWSDHKTPIDNLYLCGSGVHGGGGVSGVSGRNVVKVLKA